MQCRECKSKKIPKNGKKRGKQNHICVQCGRQFITEYNQHFWLQHGIAIFTLRERIRVQCLASRGSNATHREVRFIQV